MVKELTEKENVTEKLNKTEKKKSPLNQQQIEDDFGLFKAILQYPTSNFGDTQKLLILTLLKIFNIVILPANYNLSVSFNIFIIT